LRYPFGGRALMACLSPDVDSDVVLLPESFPGVAPSAPVRWGVAPTDLSHKVFVPGRLADIGTSTRKA